MTGLSNEDKNGLFHSNAKDLEPRDTLVKLGFDPNDLDVGGVCSIKKKYFYFMYLFGIFGI